MEQNRNECKRVHRQQQRDGNRQYGSGSEHQRQRYGDLPLLRSAIRNTHCECFRRHGSVYLFMEHRRYDIHDPREPGAYHKLYRYRT